MSSRYIPEHRRTQFKATNSFKPDELRRRREEQQVEIRRQKREENLAKRRGIQGRDGGVNVGDDNNLDSDDDGLNLENEVCISQSRDFFFFACLLLSLFNSNFLLSALLSFHLDCYSFCTLSSLIPICADFPITFLIFLCLFFFLFFFFALCLLWVGSSDFFFFYTVVPTEVYSTINPHRNGFGLTVDLAYRVMSYFCFYLHPSIRISLI